MTAKPPSHETAKTIVISVVLTVGIIASLVYSFRQPLIEYIFTSIEPAVTARMPVLPEHVSSEERVIAAITAANPAVVSVIVTKDVPIFERYYEVVNPWGLLNGFTVPRIRENGSEEREVGGGSGFLVSGDGLIVTNRHVVDDEEARYSVVLADNTVYDAVVVDLDAVLDIAVLQISELPETALPFIRFGNSDELRLGQTVIAIGNALAEFQNSVSLGIVSGLGRSVVASDVLGNDELLRQVIQTDAAINPGNSGGPLLNLDGEVIGVNVATTAGADNIGFALPSQIVSQVVESVKKYGEIQRPFLGVRYRTITPEIQQANALTSEYGAEIVFGPENKPGIKEGSPADLAGLTVGDIIVAIDYEPLVGRDLATELRNKSVGQEISLQVVRGSETLMVTATLIEAQ